MLAETEYGWTCCLMKTNLFKLAHEDTQRRKLRRQLCGPQQWNSAKLRSLSSLFLSFSLSLFLSSLFSLFSPLFSLLSCLFSLLSSFFSLLFSSLSKQREEKKNKKQMRRRLEKKRIRDEEKTRRREEEEEEHKRSSQRSSLLVSSSKWVVFLYNACPPPLDRIVAESMRAQLRVKLCGGPQHTACVLYTTLAIAKTTLTPPTCTHGAQDPSARRFAGRPNNTHPVQLHPYFCFQICERTGSRSVKGKCRVFKTDVAVAKLLDPKAAVNWTYSPRKCAHLQPQGIDFNDHSSVALGHNRPLFAHQLNVSASCKRRDATKDTLRF